MPPEKVDHCSVEHLSGFDVHSVPGVGSDHLEPWELALGKGTVRHKALFTLAADEKRWDSQVSDPLAHGNIGCSVAQGVRNPTRGVELRIRQQHGMDVRREPFGMDGMDRDALERCVTVPLNSIRLLHRTHPACLHPLRIREAELEFVKTWAMIRSGWVRA